jgi:hypothetical protein
MELGRHPIYRLGERAALDLADHFAGRFFEIDDWFHHSWIEV